MDPIPVVRYQSNKSKVFFVIYCRDVNEKNLLKRDLNKSFRIKVSKKRKKVNRQNINT